MSDEKLPPLIQEIRSDASQALSEQDRFNSSTTHMADHSESEGKRAHGGFADMALGLGLANLAADGVEKTLEGLHKVIETGIDRAKDDAQINAQLAAGLQSTGGAAGTTVKGMDELGESIARMSGQSADSIEKTESLLLTFTNIKNVGPDKIFDETTLAAANMAARFGGDATQSAIQLGKALNDPVKGMTALRRVGVSFTADQEAQVKAMVAAGDTMGAQKVILAELNTEFGNSAKAAGETLPGAIARAKESFSQMSGQIVSSFLPAITPIFSKMVDLMQDVAPHIEHFGEMLADGLGKAGPILAPFGAAFADAFKSAQPLLEAVMGAFQQLGPVIAGVVPPLLQAIEGVSPLTVLFKALTPIMPVLVSAIGTLASSLGGALTSALNTLAPLVASIAQMLATGLVKVITELVPIIAPLVSVVGTLATSLSGALLGAVQALLPAVIQIAEVLASGLMKVLTDLMPIIPPLIGVVATLASSLGGVLSTAVQALLPVIVQVVDILTSGLGNRITELVPVITQLAQIVGQVLATAMTALSPILTMLGALLEQVFKAVEPLIPVVLSLVGALLPLLAPIIQLVGSLLSPLIGLLTTLLQPILSLVTGLIGMLVPAITQVVQWFSQYLGPVIQAAQMIIQGISDFVGGVFSGNWSRAWQGIQQIFSGVWDGIKSIASGALNGVIDLVNGAIGTIDDALSGISKATGGLINLNIPKIPHFADGGEVPGGPGAPVLAVVHGGEQVLSQAMLDGRAPIPQSVRDRVGGASAAPVVTAGGGSQVFNVQVTQSDPSAEDIAAALGFAFRTAGG